MKYSHKLQKLYHVIKSTIKIWKGINKSINCNKVSKAFIIFNKNCKLKGDEIGKILRE